MYVLTRYSMENADVPFSIDEASGELFTTDVLDRETVAEYRLTVIATDKHPTEPLSSSVLITVLIGDINDHWPQFLNSPYVAYVPTEIEPGMRFHYGLCVLMNDKTNLYCHKLVGACS